MCVVEHLHAIAAMDMKRRRGGWSSPYRKTGPAFLTHHIPYEQLYTPEDALGTSGNWIITFVTLLPTVTFRNPVYSIIIYDPEQISTHLPAKYKPDVNFACSMQLKLSSRQKVSGPY
jgi:hypothetical protein